MATRARATIAGLGAALSVLLASGAARGEAPLSAIDWLSKSVATPALPSRPEEPAVSPGALASDVTVSVLDAPTADAAGLLPASTTGLPAGLWGLGKTDEIAALIGLDRSDALPALKGLLMTLLLAELRPPADAGTRGKLLLSRVDSLLEMGALDQAGALLEAAGTTNPDRFRRAFDVALLTGAEDRACVEMMATPALAPTFPARVFCLARSGDWNAAALTLRVGVTLGYVAPADEALLSRFLDPELYEGEGTLPPPSPVTPLAWRMLEAIGETLPTGGLPLAFSHAELRDTAGWKAQVEAAERLTRAGVLEPNVLLGLYTARAPAASGGVWDRVAAFQTFEAALASGDAARTWDALPAAWARMSEAELEVPFAELFADRLAALPAPLPDTAFRILLLSVNYERAADHYAPKTAVETFAAAVAKGDVSGVTPPDSLARAIAAAFAAPDAGPALTGLVEGDRLGEAILMAIDRVRGGVQGDLRGVSEGLSLLRQVGLEDAARRTALELLLLERRG